MGVIFVFLCGSIS